MNTIALIQPSQRCRGAQRTHLLQPTLQRYRRHPHAHHLMLTRSNRYRVLFIADLDVANFSWVLAPNTANVHW